MKIIKNSIVVCIMLLLVQVTSTVFAYNPYPTYLGDDHNFILCDGHMGTAWYVDRTSLTVQKYDPPIYMIAINVVRVDQADEGNTSIADVKTSRFFYNYDSQKMYFDKDGTSNWVYLPPQGSWAETGIRMPAGEIAFALAYNLKFYGGRAWYNQFLHRSTVVFDDSFYDRL
jgi:hypothetical protein